jgi:ubiquinone/menaquinone biosynthesis C-methylase UbiE
MGWLTASTSRYAAMSAVHGARQLAPAPGETVIEIGPGSGEALVEMLGMRPGRLVAFEPSPQFCNQLQGMSNLQVPEVEIVCDDALKMHGIQDSSVDKVLGMDVVYFLDPLEDYLAEVWRVLKPGGWILFGFKEVSPAINDRDAVNRYPHKIVEKLERAGFAAGSEETRIRQTGKRKHNGDYITILGMKPEVGVKAAPHDPSV